MTSPTLSELLRQQKEASIGPWTRTDAKIYGPGGVPVARVWHALPEVERGITAEFIAAARNFDLKGLQTQYEAMRAILERLEHWGCTEDKMFTATREKTLFKLISDAQTVLHEAKP